MRHLFSEWLMTSAIVFTLLGLPFTAQGVTPIRDQGQIFGTGGFLQLGTDEWSQSITTGIKWQLAGIQIQFGLGIPTPTPTLRLSIFDGGNPLSGSALFSEQLNLTSADLDDSNLFTWDFSSANLFFDVGDVFSFVLQADAVGYRIEGNDPPGYVGGDLFRNRVAFAELSDIAFITYVEPPPLVDLSGTIEAPDGTDICAMVLASGQYTFSCNPVGVFSLSGLPRETDGTVKQQIYAHGFFPKINVLPDSTNEAVVMTRSGVCPNYNIPYEPAFVPGSAGEEIYIAGEVLLQNSVRPICAMVRANGQYMFSCDATGSYFLKTPLDENGQFKLQVYADGFAPSIRTFDEFKTTNIVRMACAVECQ